MRGNKEYKPPVQLAAVKLVELSEYDVKLAEVRISLDIQVCFS